MAVTRKAGAQQSRFERLQKQNASLRKKLKSVEAERDALLKAVHAWSKEKVTAATVAQWFGGGGGGAEIEGSLMDIIEDLRSEKKAM